MKMLKVIGIVLLILIIVILVILCAVLIFLFFAPSVGKLPDKSERESFSSKNDLYYDGKFHNENDVTTMSSGDPYSSSRKTPKTMIASSDPSLIENPEDGDLTFTWIGHSSFLLQMGETKILVDPVMSDRSSPVGFAGPKRFSELPWTTDELPEIDVLFISHDHYDHLDYQTIKAIKDKVGKVIVPLGVDTILKGWGVDEGKITALNWWESVTIDGITYTLTPSQHFTGRNPIKGNSTLWGGLYLSDGYHKVYYTGDGGYYDIFSRVGETLGAPDLMIAECGQYDPSWAKIHMFPEQTVQAGVDAKAAWLIPVHWGTFSICNTDWDDSIIRASEASKTSGLNLATPRIGQTVDYDEISSFTEAWWEEYA
ncbi:MAG: MBL fold metallo-hydrolase [Clostridia bacterium]|nr:MBL fold metallo-hydrolase [Clostridia bacterium]